MLAARAEAREARVPRFTPVPRRRKRLSTRGERGETFRTKRHTAARHWPVPEAKKTDEQKARETRLATNQRRGVELVHTLYARAMA